ncbi:MAG: chorismate-binding protein [Alphaproteobacteria bacterium]|nr:chorismate-binding protein [Alphaproteobacteria bacterium]MBU1514432.1 chorismate-binding protein [Alphaproteobacteria bacterium]MBU2097087.1 chorismate-binding protein [Alphaproteobacteria bacterium]MBU2153566.1 chorismate-binding protein [Alphaproteobacteria bacterium]MBU2308631.1 chorismate-binding protein [Alphaproteobacteria bacterium]
MWSRAANNPDRPATALACVATRATAWADPVEVASAFAGEVHACVLLSGDDGWSYVLRRPDAVVETGRDLEALLAAGEALVDGPPFQGGVVGLAAYELSAELEATAPQVRGDWPDLILLRYPALLAFHAGQRRALAIGRGPDPRAAAAAAAVALSWLDAPRAPARTGVLAADVTLGTTDDRHAEAVAETVERIAAGEIFQANLARPWRGRLAAGVKPFDLFRRLAGQSAAGYAAFLNLPGRALVSNSPERFLSVRRHADGLWAETHPIKGTRPRGADPASDAALAAELQASEKDRAENLMIVDLMRNDLARVSVPGTVQVPALWGLESYANVHHLVSRVRARLHVGRTAWDAFLAAFPPGSVTGAPKLQAMQVIARHEPPRGPYCGSLFWAGVDGALEASVLIRTIALTENAAGWAFEARAGGGIVADSDPRAEVAETTTKIGAILKALTEGP